MIQVEQASSQDILKGSAGPKKVDLLNLTPLQKPNFWPILLQKYEPFG